MEAYEEMLSLSRVPNLVGNPLPPPFPAPGRGRDLEIRNAA